VPVLKGKDMWEKVNMREKAERRKGGKAEGRNGGRAEGA